MDKEEMMTTFLALYRGETILGASLVAVSADQKIVSEFGKRLIADEPEDGPDQRDCPPSANGYGADVA
jgi:hypothetical protein